MIRAFAVLSLLCAPLCAEPPRPQAVKPPPAPAVTPVPKVQPTPTPVPSPTPIDALDHVNLKLVDIFNSEQLPGAGSLTYKAGDKEEKVVLGEAGGYYALGMVFDGSLLPDQYGADFKKNQIIQLTLGLLKSKLSGQVPQFGAVTLITNQLPRAKKKYPLVVPSGTEGAWDEMGFLLVTSPTTPNDRSDEDKLKSTYFALSGSLTVMPRGASHLMALKSQGKRLAFTMRIFRVVVDAALVTPFNASPGSLKGTIEVPVYSPYGKEARDLTLKIATESLETAASMAGPKGLTKAKGGSSGTHRKARRDK